MAELKWWQSAVFYQIYPRSFADGNGDGIGDLQGIIAKLDYLKDLGIDAIWLSPHYPSPQFDCGYDIADYTDVDPEYGTVDEFHTFLAEAHRRDLKVILDLVLNHTSDQHPWFQESRSSKDSPKRDWYVWHDGVADGPPNNWCAAFDDRAWTYDEATDQWYYHFFFAEQPDLNWRSPEVKQAMWDAVRFWLDLGVDGFRLDAIGTVYEDPALPDHEAELDITEQLQRSLAASTAGNKDPELWAYLTEQRRLMNLYQVDQPGIHELLQELRTLVDTYPGDRVLVGEVDEVVYHGDGTNELHLVFNFPLMRTDKLTPAWIRDNQAERLAALPPQSWPCNTLGNHDCDRLASSFGTTDALARLSLALMLTLKGTPFLYNGEEIGMSNLVLADIAQFRDNLGVWIYRTMIEQLDMAPEAAFDFVKTFTRDKCRSPLHWENAPNAGFSPAEAATWLPVNANYKTGVNVADQQDDPVSMLNFYRQMLAVRKNTPALIAGEYQVLHTDAAAYFAFLRSTPEQTCLVVLNYADQGQKISLDLKDTAAKLVYTNAAQADTLDLGMLAVAPFEILIAELES